MKQILIILGLFASVSTFAQSPRIKLNQITKDTVKGSVLISSPSDSGMVYSRDFYIAYGADTVLILYGDTISGGGGLSSVLTDNVTITGDGSVGNPLKVDTLLISTIQGLVDSLSNYVTTNTSQTITGAKTFTNTFTQSGGDANFDSGTLFVDESENKVGIGTSSPQGFLSVEREFPFISTLGLTVGDPRYEGVFQIKTSSGGSFMPTFEGYGGVEDATLPIGMVVQGSVDTSKDLSYTTQALIILQGREYDNFPLGFGPVENAPILAVKNYNVLLMKVEANGNVGIGTSSPAYKLDVVGDINASGEVRNSGVILISDARYKKDITPLYNANDKLMLFNPVSYYWNDLMLQRMEESKSKTKTSIKYGLVAQEVEAIMPEFVSEGEDGYKAIDYQAIITLLIKSNQEQQTEIEQLKTLITDLTNRLIILENK